MPIKPKRELEAELERMVERAARVRDAVQRERDLRSQAEPTGITRSPVGELSPTSPLGKA